jgi:hypothetical protein
MKSTEVSLVVSNKKLVASLEEAEAVIARLVPFDDTCNKTFNALSIPSVLTNSKVAFNALALD